MVRIISSLMWSEVECERRDLTTPAQIWSSTKYCLRWRSPNMLLYPQNEKLEREESQKMVWTSAEGQCAAAYNRELERRKMTLNRLRRLATKWTMQVWLQAGRLQILRRILLKAPSMFNCQFRCVELLFWGQCFKFSLHRSNEVMNDKYCPL